MENALDRIELLVGVEKLEIIKNSTIIVFGCGGVGAMCAESLVRHGIGHIILVDHDVVSTTNINRQIHATTLTVGQKKIDALSERLKQINPSCLIEVKDIFVDASNLQEILTNEVDVIVDAIDTVTSKLLIIEYAQNHKISLISCMGMGNRLDPTQVGIVQLRRTFNDPLSKVMRYECRKRGLNDKMLVVSSTEIPIKQNKKISESTIFKESMPPASSSFVPLAAGLACGHQVISYVLEKEKP
jgi:tRNA A37 threonylcarbamoyladenosine dehydratase